MGVLQYQLLTYVLDYILYGSLLYLLFLWFGSEKLSPLKGGLSIVGCIAIGTIRDELYKRFFPTTVVSHFKQNYKITPKLMWNMVTSVAFVAGSIALNVYLELFHCTIHENLLWTYAIIQMEMLSMTLLKDLSMYWLHDFMHDRNYPWFYKIHKNHHQVTKQIAHINHYYFDIADLFIENVCAPVIFLFAKFLLFGGYPSMHIFSYILLVIEEGNLHSVNPFTIIYFNPVFDYFFKSTITHNLHHTFSKGYLTFLPYKHLLKSEREKDVNVYNKFYETSIVL